MYFTAYYGAQRVQHWEVIPGARNENTLGGNHKDPIQFH